jgi:hypothetical protein
MSVMLLGAAFLWLPQAMLFIARLADRNVCMVWRRPAAGHMATGLAVGERSADCTSAVAATAFRCSVRPCSTGLR